MAKNYQKNFLTHVLFRIDFLNPIKEFGNGIPVKLKKIILSCFPIEEPISSIGAELQLNQNLKESKINEIIHKEWNFYSKDKNKKLQVTKDYFFVEYFMYDNFEEFKLSFLPSIEAMFANIKDFNIKRVGLRYIDNINIDGDIFDWGKYIHEDLLSILKIKDQNNISRAIGMYEKNYPNYNVRFQYGMHNPDYPSSIRKKIFMMDTDVYFQGLIQDQKTLEDLLPDFHSCAKEIFEDSILEDLRILMNGK